MTRILLVVILAGFWTTTVTATDPVTISEETPQAKDAAELVVAPRPSMDQVIARFIDFLQTRDSYDTDVRAFVRKSASELTAASKRDFLNSALALLSPDYARGLELLSQEKSAEAAELFERLSRDDDPYLAVAAANQAATALMELDAIERCREILLRIEETHVDIERYTLQPDQFYFMLGYCQIHDLDYEAATETLTGFLRRYPDAPERLRVTATQILTEIERRVPGQLGDVRDLMNYARRRLTRGDVDEVVIARQQQAVDLLSAMIQEAEDREKSQNNCKQCGGGKCKGGHGAPKGAQQPGGGAQQSTLPGGESQVGELRRTQARPGEEWGRMPPREREEILQTLQRRFPSQYRDLLEQYYRQLAKDAPPQ